MKERRRWKGSLLFPRGEFDDFQYCSPPCLVCLWSLFSLPISLALPWLHTAIANHKKTSIFLLFPIQNNLDHRKPFTTTSCPQYFQLHLFLKHTWSHMAIPIHKPDTRLHWSPLFPCICTLVFKRMNCLFVLILKGKEVPLLFIKFNTLSRGVSVLMFQVINAQIFVFDTINNKKKKKGPNRCSQCDQGLSYTKGMQRNKVLGRKLTSELLFPWHPLTWFQ